VVEERWRAGEHSATVLESLGKAVLGAVSSVSTDYFAVTEPERLDPVAEAAPGSIVMVAARVGRTRLLDNIILGA